MHKKLGIIAGGGAIPQDLINFCKENKRDYFVIAIECPQCHTDFVKRT